VAAGSSKLTPPSSADTDKDWGAIAHLVANKGAGGGFGNGEARHGNKVLPEPASSPSKDPPRESWSDSRGSTGTEHQKEVPWSQPSSPPLLSQQQQPQQQQQPIYMQQQSDTFLPHQVWQEPQQQPQPMRILPQSMQQHQQQQRLQLQPQPQLMPMPIGYVPQELSYLPQQQSYIPQQQPAYVQQQPFMSQPPSLPIAPFPPPAAPPIPPAFFLNPPSSSLHTFQSDLLDVQPNLHSPFVPSPPNNRPETPTGILLTHSPSPISRPFGSGPHSDDPYRFLWKRQGSASKYRGKPKLPGHQVFSQICSKSESASDAGNTLQHPQPRSRNSSSNSTHGSHSICSSTGMSEAANQPIASNAKLPQKGSLKRLHRGGSRGLRVQTSFKRFNPRARCQLEACTSPANGAVCKQGHVSIFGGSSSRSSSSNNSRTGSNRNSDMEEPSQTKPAAFLQPFPLPNSAQPARLIPPSPFLPPSAPPPPSPAPLPPPPPKHTVAQQAVAPPGAADAPAIRQSKGIGRTWEHARVRY